VFGSATTILPAERLPAGGRPAARLSAARGEAGSFQVAVQAGHPLRRMSVSLAGALHGPGGARIPETQLAVYREGYVRISVPSDGELWAERVGSAARAGDTSDFRCDGAQCLFPDPLIPERDAYYGERRDAFPLDVPEGQNRVAWVDVDVPANATPGRYRGTVEVNARGLHRRIPVALRVLPLTLPATTSLRGGFGLDANLLCPAHGIRGCDGPRREELWRLDALYVRAALDNRVSIGSGFVPPVGRDAAYFQRYIAPLVRGTDAPVPGTSGPPRLPGARITDIVLNRFAAPDAADWARQALANRFEGRTTFFCDEVGQDRRRWADECDRPYRRAAEGWKGADDVVRLGGAGGAPRPLPVAFTGTIDQLDWARQQGFAAARAVSTLIPNVADMQPRGAPFPGTRSDYDGFLQASPGSRLWMYQSCLSVGCDSGPIDYTPGSEWDGWPSYSIDQPATEALAMPWILFEYDSSGEYYYETVSRLAEAWDPCRPDRDSVAGLGCLYNYGGNGDGTLFYPGTPDRIGGRTDIPIESIRLKRIRDGRSDYEYLRYLSSHGMKAEALSVARDLFPNAADTDGQASVPGTPEDDAGQAAVDEARRRLVRLAVQSSS
jgi:hypothetical protein